MPAGEDQTFVIAGSKWQRSMQKCWWIVMRT